MSTSWPTCSPLSRHSRGTLPLETAPPRFMMQSPSYSVRSSVAASPSNRLAWGDVHVTADDFRRIALSLPEAVESAHMDHPDFRVRNKVFATLGYPGEAWAMVKLTPEQQAEFVHAEPDVFVAVTGGWGRSGATNIRLETADEATTRHAVVSAWRNVAPKRRSRELD
jgi:hypothetical protein